MHPNKVQYSIEEAALKLGLSTEDLSVLVRQHLSEDLPPGAVLHASDLVVIRIIAARRPAAAA